MIDFDAMRPRRPYQLPVAVWVRKPEQDTALLFLEKRLGKCAMTIDWLDGRRDKLRTVLIVAPFSAWKDWESELQADGFHDVVFLEGTAEEKEDSLLAYAALPNEPYSTRIFLVNSQALFQCAGKGNHYRDAKPTAVALFPYDAVVWDETTVGLPTPTSQVNFIAQNHLVKAPYRMGLSGEYRPERTEQIFEQVRFAKGEFMGTRNFWNWRAQNFIQRGFKWMARNPVGIKAEVAKVAYILSRKDVGFTNEPAFETRYCRLPKTIRAAYDTIDKEFRVDLGSVVPCLPCDAKGWVQREYGEEMCESCKGQGQLSSRETNIRLVVENWLTQIAGGFPGEFPHLWSEHKQDLLLEVLEEYRHEPVVVVFRFNDELAQCYQRLKREEWSVDYITGAIQPPQRRQVSHNFQRGSTKVLLMQAKCTHGMNLSVSDTMLWYSIPQRWEDISQPMDRIVDLEKKSQMCHIHLICEGTKDEDLSKLSRNKRASAAWFSRALQDSIRPRARPVTEIV